MLRDDGKPRTESFTLLVSMKRLTGREETYWVLKSFREGPVTCPYPQLLRVHGDQHIRGHGHWFSWAGNLVRRLGSATVLQLDFGKTIPISEPMFSIYLFIFLILVSFFKNDFYFFYYSWFTVCCQISTV